MNILKKNALYKKIAELEKLARDRYLDVQSNSPAYTRYMAQLDELTRLKHMVYDFPSAEVAPVKHGKWIAIKNPYGKIEGWMHEDCGRQSDEASEYCPNCGAKMDLED